MRRTTASGRALAAIAAGALAVPATFVLAGPAFATGRYPGNETALPPAALSTATACPPNDVMNPGFTDISGDYFQVAIDCLADYGVTHGTTSTTYSPAQTVNRDEMAEFFYRLGTDAGYPWKTTAPSPNYTDAGSIPATFQPAVYALTNAGIVGGYPDGTYRPGAAVSRGEMSKFIYNFLKVVAKSAPSANGQDYFYDDDGTTFENPYLNGDAGQGLYVGRPGSGGGELAVPGAATPRDEMAGFLSRVLQVLVTAHLVPNHFAPTYATVSPASAPAGSTALVTVRGTNITDVSVAGPCTGGANQANTPAANNAPQAITLSVPVSSTATTGACTLTATVVYADGTKQTLSVPLTVTPPAAPAGTYKGLTVVSADPADASFVANTGTASYTFSYGQPGDAYSYDETPGSNASTTPASISESQFASYLSGPASPAPGDMLNVTYGGAQATGTFAFAGGAQQGTVSVGDVPAAATGVTASPQAASGSTPAGVLVTWTAPDNPDVFAYQVQSATVNASGTTSAFRDVTGGAVLGSQSAAGVVTAAPATSFVDTTQTSGTSVVYRVIAYADGNNGNACAAATSPACTSTLADAGAAAPVSTPSAAFTVGSTGTAVPAAAGPAAGITAITAPPAAPSAGTVYVATTGKDGSSCGTQASPCQTINAGIANAANGDTVSVAPGIYHEQVVVTKSVTLAGFGATVDASGLTAGSGTKMDAAAVLVPAPGSGATVEGLTVHGAYGEGILVAGASKVVVEGNTVSGNDLGTPQTTSYLACQAQGQVPGDCGEGVHLMSATDSTVVDNVVMNNSGGILTTDEIGPSTGNTVTGNLVQDNIYDCGITVPSHNPNALSSSGAPQPTQGGVYGNTFSDNMVFGNGTVGVGAGILIAAAGPGMASYDNTVSGNLINGNGMSGVTIHSHAPNQDVSGNLVENNVIGQNNIKGDPDAGVTVTTGVLVFSAVVPTTETVTGNTIYDNVQPTYYSKNVTAS